MDIVVQISIVVLCLSGAVAFGAITKLVFRAGKAIDTVEGKVNPLFDEAAGILSDARPAVDALPSLVSGVSVTVDSANKVIEDVSIVTGHVANASDKIFQAAKVPGEIAKKAAAAVHDFTKGK